MDADHPTTAMQDTFLGAHELTVRTLLPKDLEAILRIDTKVSGRRREESFKRKLAEDLAEIDIKVYLAAEINGALVGFLLAHVLYGEFGIAEPVAVLDTLGVDPSFHGQGVGHALMAQLRAELRELGIRELRSEVAWDDVRLVRFFQREGFTPAQRLCLTLRL